MSIDQIDKYNLKFLGDSPVVYHCHHFNLFLDQTIDDAVGASGAELKRLAGRRAAAELLPPFLVDAVTPVERLEIAKELFASMGQGRLRFEVTETGGEASATTLHYGVSWSEKYGQTIKNNSPVDHFAAGFAACAAALAFGNDGESLDSTETHCIAKRDGQCKFQIAPGAPALPSAPAVNKESIIAELKRSPSLSYEDEDTISAITSGLNSFLSGVTPDSRGLIEAFGVYVTVHLANYYNAVSFGALREVEKRSPGSAEVLADLLRESGQVCVFNTFGGMILSPEWEALVGTPENSPRTIALWCLSIARALGFGHWSLEEFIPGKEMVISTPANYESTYFAIRETGASSAPEFFFQGAAVAIMHLAHHVDWRGSPKFTHEEYVKLFEDDELPWRFEQENSGALGESISRVRVRARG